MTNNYNKAVYPLSQYLTQELYIIASKVGCLSLFNDHIGFSIFCLKHWLLTKKKTHMIKFCITGSVCVHYLLSHESNKELARMLNIGNGQKYCWFALPMYQQSMTWTCFPIAFFLFFNVRLSYILKSFLDGFNSIPVLHICWNPNRTKCPGDRKIIGHNVLVMRQPA